MQNVKTQFETFVSQVCLREQMGEEKYQAYAVMVRQLKFFEDISFKG